MELTYPLWLGLLAILVAGGWLLHRQFDEARRERHQIMKGIDFLEKEIGRLRERLPLSDRDREALKMMTEQDQPHKDTNLK